MSIGMGSSFVFRSTNVNLNQSNGTVIATFRPFKPMDVLRWAVVNNNAEDIPTATVLTLQKRPTAGSSSGAETIATLSPSEAVPQGEGLYMNVVADDDPSSGDAPLRVTADPGEEIAVVLTTQAGGTSTGHLFLEVIERAFQRTSGDPEEDRLRNMTRVAQ